MKRVFVFMVCILCFVLAGCDQPVYNAQFQNVTDNPATIAYEAEGVTRLIVVEPHQIYKTSIPHSDISSIRAVKDSSNQNIIDNKFVITTDWVMSYISSSPIVTYNIVSLINDERYGVGGKLYLREKNNKIEEYYNPADATKVQIRPSLSPAVTQITVYTNSPEFILEDASGVKFMLNDLPVSCEVFSNHGNNFIEIM